MSLASLFRNSQTTSTHQTQHLPRLNELTASLQSYFSASTQTSKKKRLMKWVKSIPELMGILNKVAKDIAGDYHFEPVNQQASNRNKILQANSFALEVGYRRNLFSRVFDILALGESFAWKGNIKKKQVEAAIRKALDSRPFLEQKEAKDLYSMLSNELTAFDEDLRKPRKLRYVASSTTEVHYDEYDILKYIQDVGTQKVEFSPEEIIRTTFQEIDGRVSGFTPVESLVLQLELLRLMWSNQLGLQTNGGHPDKIFLLKNTRPTDPRYKQIHSQLMEYKNAKNRHGNMLLTGEIDVLDMMQLDKMQFMDLGLYVTSVIAMMWQVPRSSLPYIVQGTNTKDDTGGNSEKGYFENIEYAQELFAETENSQLWIPHFGVKLVFDRKYTQKDVQTQTAKQLKLGNMTTINELLRAGGKQLKADCVMKEFGITPDDVEEYEQPDFSQDPKSTMNNQLSKNQVNDGSDKQNMRLSKANQQASTQGKLSNTGTGKAWDKNAELEFKELIGQPDELVGMSTFVKLYNEDKSYQEGKPPRIFMRQNPDFTSFKFKSSDFVYKTVIPTDELEERAVQIMNLGGVYKL